MHNGTPGIDACPLAPSFDDLALIAAVDDEAAPEVLEHLRVCPRCAARAREFAELQRTLRQKLFRAFCPTSEELAAFQQGMLEGGHQVYLRAHLAECPYCSREAGLLNDFFTPRIPRR